MWFEASSSRSSGLFRVNENESFVSMNLESSERIESFWWMGEVGIPKGEGGNAVFRFVMERVRNLIGASPSSENMAC